MTDFNDVVKIVAENGYLEPKHLIIFQKQIGDCTLAWKKINEKYKEFVQNTARPSAVKFDKGTDLISTTRSKKEYKLDEEDLSCLNLQYVYVRKARSHFPFFKTSDVIDAHFRKYGLAIVNQHKEKINKKSQKLDERRVQLQDMLDDDNACVRSVLSHSLCTQFISNGLQKLLVGNTLTNFRYVFYFLKCKYPKISDEHAKSVALRVFDFRELKDNDLIIKTVIDEEVVRRKKAKILAVLETYPDYKILYREFRSLFSSFSVDQTPEQIITNIRGHLDRQDELRERLSEHGLELRDDSAVCEYYIYNERGVTLDDAVNTMIEMNWFYNYSQANE